MGLLCDLFVANREDALGYEVSALGDRGVHLFKDAAVEFKEPTGREFGILWALLADETWDLEKHMLVDVAFGVGNETWLHKFQNEFVSLLSKLDEKMIQDVSALWGETEELSCGSDDVRPIVEALVRLSQNAIAEREGVYMWGSL